MPKWLSSVFRSVRHSFNRPSKPILQEHLAIGHQNHIETPLLGERATVPVVQGTVKNDGGMFTCVTRPRVSGSSTVVSILLVLCSCITSTTLGYDASMMNGLNMLPSYTDYFHLNMAT